MFDWQNRTVITGAAAVLISGFCVGFLTAKATEGGGRANRSSEAVSISETVGNLYGKPRDKNAPRASDKKPAGFAVWKQSLDTSASSPRACIEFSRDLDPSKPYGDYVLVSPELPSAPAVSVKGANLCVSGFGFTDRRITLLKGLPGKGNDKLEKNVDLDFAFGEKPPYVGFAGEGVILPREDSDGVAIETLNVTSLNFEVWRVADRNLVRQNISAPDPLSEGDYDYEWGEDSPNENGAKVWSGKVAVRAGNGERITTVFPLGAVLKNLKPGAYVIKVRDASGGRDKAENDQPAQARRWILYTDMALMTYSGNPASGAGLDVVVRSLKSAKPLSGVRVALVARNGEDLAEGRSGTDGRVRFNPALLKGEGALTPKMVMAYGPAEDFTALDLDRAPVDLSAKGVGGRQDEAVTAGRAGAGMVDGYLYTDRGIYRPGEMVHVVALVRDPQGKAIKDRKGALVVTRPSGVEAFRVKFDKSENGYVAADIALPKSSPRGQWQARLEVEGLEGAAGSAAFAVEDFAPQRLGVDIAADADKPLTRPDEARAVRVNARFLYGATGSGLTVGGEARVRADTNPFPAFKDYRFGNEQNPFEEKYVNLPETVTDGQGQATFPLEASVAGDTDQPLSVLLTSSVFEPGGRPVKESATLRIRTKPLYLGVKVDAQDTKGNAAPRLGFNIIGLNAQGQKIAASGVKVRLVSENWNYDWYQQDGRWAWRRTARDVVVSETSYDLNAGTGLNFARNLDWGDYRLEIEHPQTGARTVVRFASGWGNPAKSADAPDFVRLSAGTKAYVQGDTITLTFKPPYEGEAQIAVASDRLIDMKHVRVGEDGTTLRLKSDASWGGGVYIMVSVMQPRDPVTSPKPRRAMGLIYVPLDPKSRKLTVAVDAPKGTPQKPVIDKMGDAWLEVPVKVSGAKLGERARLSLAVVDQGILNLTKFKAPDPISWYFGKRALGVDYRDDYGRLLDPNLGAPAELNYGGDQIGGEGLTVTPIKTVALWSGVVETGFDGKAVVRLKVPKFNGELKVMAVAWTDEAVGSSQETITVREPVVAELALPRFLAPGDKAFATLELNNVDGKTGLYEAVVTGLKGLFVQFKKAFNLATGQRVQEAIEINAPQRAGISAVNLSLKADGYSFNEDYNLQTRNGWGTRTQVFTEQQGVNQTYAPSRALLEGLQPGTISIQVSYSPFRGIDPTPLAAALNRYPYGCTEQISSAAYPWLYVSPSLTDTKTSARGQMILKQAVGRILDRQSADGAFGLWKAGDGAAEGFVGAFATDFILEAQKQGVYVPQEALDKAMNAMRDMSRPDGFTSVNYRLKAYDGGWFGLQKDDITAQIRSRASAYALYVMAKGGNGDLARLRWYHDVQFKSERSPLARAQVAAALSMMGDKARARSGFKQAVQALGYKDPHDWYQSPLRDLAGVTALAYEAGETGIAADLAKRLETSMKDPERLNTQEQAFILRAVSYMLKAAGPIKIDAQGVATIPSQGSLARYNVGAVAQARFKNTGSGPLWRTVTVTGNPLIAPPAESKGFTLEKAYYTLDGARINPAQLTQGQKVLVVISGRSSYAQTRPIVVDDALPAGFEIETTLTNEDTQNGPFRFAGALSALDAQEARDDRYVAALDVSAANGFAMAYIARATTPGDFYLPGAEVKDLYRADLYARTAGSRVTIAGR
jgi:uncharacterized protein YfaS (alpha-2-macroglobulin family)